MGCGASKEVPAGNAARPARARPRRHDQGIAMLPMAAPTMVPPTYRDDTGRPIVHQDFELDRQTITEALDFMGQNLDQQGVLASIITVGGAVNTVFLRSRRATHDVDFFMASQSDPLHAIVYAAAKSAARNARAQQREIGANWFNNATQLLIGRDLQARLAQESFEQNAVVHEYRGRRGGLIVYAAPWQYALCGKLSRLSTGVARPYDLDDAVAYLHQYLRRAKREGITAREIRGWCREYRGDATDAVLAQLNARYHQAHGVLPIEMV